MRLYVLDGGLIDILDWSVFDPTAPPGTHRLLSAPSYLVDHPAGLLLWDTGLGDALLDVVDGVEIEGVARFYVKVGLRDQLAELGVVPEQIRYLGLSHFHPDHVGNANLFSAAELLVQDDEYEAAFGPDPATFGFDADRYAALRSSRVTRLHGDHDVFGDGTVVIKRYPGHTPGSQALLLALRETGSVLLSGDVTHSPHNWSHDIVPSLNHDRDATLASFDAARKDLAESGGQLWIQHEYEQWMTLRHAPAFYE